ncbi:Carboxymuconolactone decarboxylase family protein [Paraliobacillus sp. PM-2]|uniref:carboxymuconolactone decarboxylase family protein n=1 Tax=Paraliobacillus sp. PM-2 TaxID=1462524 RepID=UPI00061C99A4|nr:carboxymuconolactone decarboxylase family protein [Paraliobacillus sp. PM-2]CQR48401.1 Carboxymuconolactone decarboxylase family protein [Paraliobacillus sp. PM-2]
MDTNEEKTYNYFDQSIMDYKEGTAYLQKTLPNVAEPYMSFTDACFKAGSLDKKQKQLMALGISVYAQDEYCIIYHTKGAVENGATEQEIAETIGVSAALGGGAAFAQGVTLALDTFHHYNQKQK